MMKHEFVAQLNALFPTPGGYAEPEDNDYETIEFVYMYHPAIQTKAAVATLYNLGGMLLINDLLPRAKQICNLENQVNSLNRSIEQVRAQIKELSK